MSLRFVSRTCTVEEGISRALPERWFEVHTNIKETRRSIYLVQQFLQSPVFSFCSVRILERFCIFCTFCEERQQACVEQILPYHALAVK